VGIHIVSEEAFSECRNRDRLARAVTGREIVAFLQVGRP